MRAKDESWAGACRGKDSTGISLLLALEHCAAKRGMPSAILHPYLIDCAQHIE